jgi:xylono-1,5-lactonase
MKVEPVFKVTTEHGEGPVWDFRHQRLYWVDLLKGDYLFGDVSTGEVKRVNVGQPLGVLALRENGGLVVAVQQGFALWDENNRQLEFLQCPEKENREIRFNDGAVDPRGRFLAGTMTFDGDKDIGNLYMLGFDHQLKKLETSLFIPNGMGWSPDHKTFYLTDTNRHIIYAYDYFDETGDITNRRPFIEFSENEYPDGLTIDAEGGFWIAMWSGSKIYRYDAKGKKLGEIPVPVQYPTSCCFGGGDMSTLFITSSQLPLSEEDRRKQPLAGRMFRIDTDVIGLPEPRFKG